MKIVYCGTVVPSKVENRIRNISNAANRFQNNFLKALNKLHTVSVLSYIGIHVDDAIKNEICKGKNESAFAYFFKSKDIISGIIKYKSAVKKALNNADCIMVYNPVYAWLWAPRIAKKMHKKSVLILADYSPVESYMGGKYKCYAKVQLTAIRSFDYVIGLSKDINVLLKPNQKFICIEGGINQAVFDYFGNEAEKNHTNFSTTFMYAGVLESVTGIDRLLEAFMQTLNPDIYLKISGKGSLEPLVVNACKEDDRIEFLGCLPYNEYLENLKNADVLINPRNMDLPENKNNFPSKIMEYLATGKPIISTRFPGYEKFSKYVYFCDSSVEGLQHAILHCESQEHDFQINRDFAANFIWESQASKISDFIEK